MDVNAFVRDGNGWRQYGIMSLAQFEANLRNNLRAATARLVATDCNTGKVVAWSDKRDTPKS